MLFRSLKHPFLAGLVLICAILPGCIGKKPISTGPVVSAPSERGAPRHGVDRAPSFKPMQDAGAVALSQKEAEKVAALLSPKQQGLNSWQDFAFPLSQSLAYAKARPQDGQAISQRGLTLTYGQLAESLEHLQKLLPNLDSSPGLLASEFTWYRIGPDFVYTGYFEPSLRASRKKSATYSYPLYRVPPDLKKGKTYHTRNDIDRRGALSGKGLEIAWVESEMDAFFLHIQGSGRLVFEDGSVSHVLYAGKNNRPYVPIGRVMKERGLLEPDNISMQSIRECLLGNPEKCAELYDTNPSYVFFREAPKGPVGAMGRPLTPYVSIATDRSVLPHGSLVCMVTPLPDASGRGNRGFYGLALPQDTGGAIKRQRIDLFCGPGEEASHNAGYMNYQGPLYILVKKKGAKSK